MAFLGVIKRSENVTLRLRLSAAATGTPTVKIERQSGVVLAPTNMSAGATSLEWYYIYTTTSIATVGAHQVSYSAVVNGVTRPAGDDYYQSVSNIDDIIGAGAYNATINVKDDSANNVSDAKVTIHSVADHDTPIAAQGTTDLSGNVTLNIEGNLKVRVFKAGFTFTSTAISVTSSTTYPVTGTANAGYDNPADPDLCRLFLYPITYGNADVTDIADELFISSEGLLTKVGGEFVRHTELNFTYNAATTPDSYYFDALQGAVAFVKCEPLGINQEILVPATANADLYDLIL